MSFSFRRSISFPSLYTVFHSGVVCSSFLTAPLINLKFNSFVSLTPDLFTPLGITGIGVLASAYYFPAGSWTALQYCCYKNLASEHSGPILLPAGPRYLPAALAPSAAVLTYLFGANYSQVSSATTLTFRILVLAISHPGYFSSNSHLLACFIF